MCPSRPPGRAIVPDGPTSVKLCAANWREELPRRSYAMDVIGRGGPRGWVSDVRRSPRVVR